MRLPSPSHWKQVAVVLKVCESKSSHVATLVFSHCGRIGLTLPTLFPNLFPTRVRIEASTGLIMCDGLTPVVA